MLACPRCGQKVRTNQKRGTLAEHANLPGGTVRCGGSFQRPSSIRAAMQEVRHASAR